MRLNLDLAIMLAFKVIISFPHGLCDIRYSKQAEQVLSMCNEVFDQVIIIALHSRGVMYTEA